MPEHSRYIEYIIALNERDQLVMVAAGIALLALFWGIVVDYGAARFLHRNARPFLAVLAIGGFYASMGWFAVWLITTY